MVAKKKVSKKQRMEQKVRDRVKQRLAAKKQKEVEPEGQEPRPQVEVREPALGNTGEKAGSRADLMAQAQLRGIKYFRILTKAELEQVLADSISPQEITVITIAARDRWHAGWGKKGPRAVKAAQPAEEPAAEVVHAG